MSSRDHNLDKLHEREVNPQSNPTLYSDIFRGHEKSNFLPTGNNAGSGGGAQFLEFSDPYTSSQSDSTNGAHKSAGVLDGAQTLSDIARREISSSSSSAQTDGSNYTREPGTPERREIIADQAKLLLQEVKSDSNSLGDDAGTIDTKIKDVMALENKDESEHNGYLSQTDRKTLLGDEASIRSELAQNSGTGGSTGDGGNTGLSVTSPPDSTTPPGKDGKFFLGSALGSPGDSAQASAFDNQVGFKQNEINMYTNNNKGKFADSTVLADDLNHKLNPMVSWRTTGTYQDVASGKDDADITKQAKALAQALKSSHTGDILLRPDWEMNLHLNTNDGSPQEFQNAWKHMHKLVDQTLLAQGADPSRVKWVYAPGMYNFAKGGGNGWTGAETEQTAKALAPYIDYVGADGYLTRSGETPKSIFAPALSMAESANKPFMITETGADQDHVSTGAEMTYMNELAQYISNNKSEFAGVSWYNTDGNGGQYQFTPQLAKAFGQMEQEIANLYGT